MSKTEVMQFDSTKAQVGLRIRNLPESCTDELLFAQVFQKLKIDTKKVKAYKVKGHKTFFNCIGNAFVYFESEEAAEDAMKKMIGFQLHDKDITCSFLMPNHELKLKNDKNIYVKNLKSTITQKQFYEAASAHGSVLSIHLKTNNLGKQEGYANYKSQPSALEAQTKGLVIDGVVYFAKILKQDQQVKKGVMSTKNRNIELHFDLPLIMDGKTEADFENQLRTQIAEKFNLYPTSVYVWGKRARHFGQASEKTIKESFGLVKETDVSDCGAPNHEGVHPCYLKGENTTCPILRYFHKKVFVCFDLKNEAQQFLDQFYSVVEGEGLKFTFKDSQDQAVVYSVDRCIPQVRGFDKAQKELEEKLNPKVVDKRYIFLKNLKKDVTVDQIVKHIEESSNTKVVSVKLSSPNEATFIRDASKKTAETRFATIQLEDAEKSSQFITTFKAEQKAREKFTDLYESYKYANYLAPKQLHKQELKEKNEKNKKQQANQNKQLPNQFAFLPPFLYNMFGNKMPIPILRNNLPMPPMNRMPMSFPAPQFNNNFRNQQGQNQNRNSNSVPPAQFNQQSNRNQNNNNNNNNYVKNNYNNNNVRNNSIGQQRTYSNNRQLQQNNNNRTYNQRNTANVNNQRYQNNDKNRPNNLQKPNTQPEKKGPLTQPANAPGPKAPIIQPTLPPKQLVIPKIEDLKDQTDEVKKQILGKPLLEKVTQELPEDQKKNAPKVTAMLLDFEINEPEEIIDMLNDVNELREQITAALELMQESTAQ